MNYCSKTWPNILPLQNPIANLPLCFKIISKFVLPTVAIFSKFWCKLNTFKIYNQSVLLKALSHPNNLPVISLSNHSSCIDDPLILANMLPWKWLTNSFRYRWSFAAHDICFTKPLHKFFFIFGKTCPIIRGNGINQIGMDFALELLRERQFIHLFPQGKVTCDTWDTKTVLSGDFKVLSLSSPEEQRCYHFKWGISRLILESIDNIGEILVIPFYHVGMDQVLPNEKPYIPRIGKRVTIYLRENPIIFNANLIKTLCKNCTSLREKRIAITTFLEEETKKLKMKAIQRHLSL